MEYEIWNETSEDRKPPVYLRLMPDGGGMVGIMVVGKSGNYCGNTLLRFTPDGRMYRCQRISPTLGFDLDDQGRIKLDGE